MIKSKYILNRIVGMTSGTALAIPMMVNNVYAADKKMTMLIYLQLRWMQMVI